MTHTTAAGTPSYRAPEQAYGRPTFASDVFAVALLFYEMVTRTLPRWPLRWPFARHDVFTARVPPALVPVIRRAASFDLDRRYRDAAAMLRAVRAAVPSLANGRVAEVEPRANGCRGASTASASSSNVMSGTCSSNSAAIAVPLRYPSSCACVPGAVTARTPSRASRASRVCAGGASITRFPGVCRRCEHAVVTGDITQVDLPSDRRSGLIEVRDILQEIPGIQFVYFDERDVVRHKLVQEIIKAYDRHQPPSSGPRGPKSQHARPKPGSHGENQQPH